MCATSASTPRPGPSKCSSMSIAQDVGRALNPALVEGQMQGGTAQGLGWALFEELAYDTQGQLTTGTFMDYALPTAAMVPSIDAEIVEVPAPEGPFGAKGIGEVPVVGVPARGRKRDRARHGWRADETLADDARTGLACSGQRRQRRLVVGSRGISSSVRASA